MFEKNDPGVTHAPVEVRYPFVDLRLMEYLLAIPAFPWAYKKRAVPKIIGRQVTSRRVGTAQDTVIRRSSGSES